MPRTARKLSKSGIYHVMLRGINKQIIFEDNEDRQFFMITLQTCKNLSCFKLHAFCLMSNHVHLLIEPMDESLSQIFIRIGSRFVGWYNRKYQREGHLFQNRFKSENVEDDQYFMTVLRYIMQNPMKAGLEAHPGNYRWSSYQAYVRGSGVITDTQYAISMFDSHDQLIRFLSQVNDDAVMDEESREWRLSDEQAQKIIEQISGCSSATEFQVLDPSLKKQYAGEMYLKKLSPTQISRLTGLGKSTIYKSVNALDPLALLHRQQLRFHEEDTVIDEWIKADQEEKLPVLW